MTVPGAVAYRRLPGRGRTPLGSDTLWVGEDHLLLVELRGFTETYRRFYFRDVQAIVLRRTDRAGVAGVLLGILGLIFLAFAMGGGPVGRVVWGTMSGLVFLALVAHMALGPSCDCALRTALQTVRLRSLGRVRRARQVIDRLRLRIELEQGTLAPEMLQIRARAAAGPAADAVEVEGAAATVPSPVPPRPGLELRQAKTRHDRGRAHEILAYVLLLSAIVVVIPVLYFHLLLSMVISLVFLGRMACLVTALVRQRDSDLPPPIKRFAWTAFGFEVAVMLNGIVTAVVMIVKMVDSGSFGTLGSTPPNPLAMVQMMQTSPMVRVSASLTSLVWLILGIRGLLVHRRLASAEGPPWQTLPT